MQRMAVCLTAGYKNARPVIEGSLENLREAMEEIRNLSHRMVMPRFSESSLEHELNKLISKYKNGGCIKLKLTAWNENNMPYVIKETLFRIAQEHLNNIHKHAQADKVIIDVKREEEHAVMWIKDNGVGFNTKQKRKGIGITNILNRAESYNGRSEFISAPGKGCTLCVSIPIRGINR